MPSPFSSGWSLRQARGRILESLLGITAVKTVSRPLISRYWHFGTRSGKFVGNEVDLRVPRSFTFIPPAE
jgi:hypothetical protein